MGFFDFNNPPSRIITEQEFDRVINTVSRKHRGVPSEEFEKIRAMAAGYLHEHGQFRGMDEKELGQFLGHLPPIVDKIYHGSLKTLETELRKALATSKYGAVGF
ncbi:MAG: hypothetical protein Q8Q39_03305 [bacterium]|nr:hypothetical protein [bacterium]